MTTTLPLSTPDLVAHIALREAAEAALRRYPDEDARIHRGMDLVQRGYVTPLPGGCAVHVRSSSKIDLVYRVNGGCSCYDFAVAPEHRYAQSLYHRQQALIGRMWFATLSLRDKGDVTGIAVPCGENTTVYAFYPEGHEHEEPIYIRRMALVFGGACKLACDQAREDGDLWQKVGDSARYQPWRESR